MATNPIVNTLYKKIKNNNSMQEYYKNKSKEPIFVRDRMVYENTADWATYWLILAEYWSTQNKQIYELINHIEKSGIGSDPFPERPELRVFLEEL